MKIAIQGTAESYHHQAVKTLLDNEIHLVSCQTTAQVFEAVSAKAVDRGLVTIENSLHGSLNQTYDLLLQHRVSIVGEVYLHKSLGLLGLPGADISTIKEVYSHASALAECRNYLDTNLPWAKHIEYYDAAASAQFVKESNDPTKAALASQQAGLLHGLIPLEEAVEDDEHNYTRFVLLNHQPISLLDSNKSSIILQTDHQPGALHKALGCFANNGINLSKLESHPIPGKSWNYVFYIDFEAGLTSSQAKQALNQLDELGFSVEILSDYVKGQLPSN